MVEKRTRTENDGGEKPKTWIFENRNEGVEKPENGLLR